MRRLGTALAIGAALALAGPAQAVTLVSSDGTPVGGQWQQWVGEMKVPTISGTLIFSTDPALLGCPVSPEWGAMGCSAAAFTEPWGTRPATVAEPGIGSVRDGFYYELGHQFDWAYLTPSDRRYLARAWGRPRWRWQDSIASLEAGREDGLEGQFPGVYASCAEGQDTRGMEIDTPFQPDERFLHPKINTCIYLDRIARRDGADMEATRLAPWNYAARPWVWTVTSARR